MTLSSQEMLQLARFALDHAEEGALWINREGSLIYANEAACRTLSQTPDELLKMSLFQISPELTPELWSQLWKEVSARESFAFEFSLRSKENRVFPVEMTVHHMPV